MYPLCSIDYAPPASRRARVGPSPRAYRRWSCAGPARSSSLNRFSQWVGFGNRGVIADNDPVEQEKEMKFNALLTNAVIFHNALDITEIVRQLLEEGWEIAPRGPGARLAVPDRAPPAVRRVLHARARHSAGGVRPEAECGFHAAA
ncbi:Tn3 family transposase [Streptomyces sp. NPDC127118]|uniref:Tn3 family transposase n=1 Tax=Streptomyces sp. NPDC127118 TaxID=3345369 RepID=UPI00362D3DDC